MIEFRYVAEGISNEVPTTQIEEFVELIDATIEALPARTQRELADQWSELREAIVDSESERARTNPRDDYATFGEEA